MKKTLWVVTTLLLTALIIICCSSAELITMASGQVTLFLNGESELTLEYGEPYIDSGATATYTDEKDNTSLDIPVEVTSHLNEQILGEYTIEYTAQMNQATGTTSRTVHVIDTQVPVIQLVSNPDNYTLIGEPYQEEGFTAVDNYDGDLSMQVSSHEENGVVTYTVSDSSGNSTTVTRTIRYFDPEPPQIELLGEATMVLFVGETYEEAGCTASDNVDGDLTSAVTVSGEVDTSQNGSYTLEYSVSDAFGNTTTKTRNVYVLSANAGSSGGYIYLTFDDGPSNYTGRLLDILAKYNVKATFFVVHTGNIGIISRAAAEGHTVAIHSTTHRFEQIYASDEAFMNDLLNMQSVIAQHTGQTTMMFRFPGGSSNTTSRLYSPGIMTRLTQNLTAMGFQYYDWNVDSKDAGGASSSDEVFYNVVNGVSQHQTSIVLQHDTSAFSVNAVERIILWGLEHGYTFLPLTFGSPTSHHGVRN